MIITTNAVINKTKQECFDYIVPIDLAHIFKKYKFLPGVIKTDNQEKWIKSGQSRTVYFDDGNTAFEELLQVSIPDDFNYKISKFTSALRLLVSHINGKWQFTEINSGSTDIVWEYELVPKNWLTGLIIKIFIQKNITTLCQNAINIIVADLDTVYNP
jgi:hypothetical protein